MRFAALAAMALFTRIAPAQEPAPAQEGGRPSSARAPEPEIRPYEKVITKDAHSQSGLFQVHRIKSRVYYEIPAAELGKEFLLVTTVARNTPGVGYGGQTVGSRVVRWDRLDNRVLLRSVSYEVVADPKNPIYRAVRASNNETILMAFPIEALGKDQAPVIEVSRLFTSEIAELSARQLLRARGFDSSRSFIDRVKVFPINLEVEALHTYTVPPETQPSAPSPAPPVPSPFGAGMRPGSATVLMHFSMVKLPEDPMMPRLYDERVGYFSVRQYDYSVEEQRAPRRTYITRWRLEKKDPSAALSEPVKPIVFYLDPATPPKWAPYVKRAVEAWQPAFEKAGFKNAILARDAPSPEQDPDWSPEDARYSVIRWVSSTVENAMGPHVHDPRTGEILEADIKMYHNVLNLVRHWYFVQVAPLDRRAQKLPLPDELMGRLVEYVVTHEVGHTLGFLHNMKASSTYPFEKVRDREWVTKMGHTPTLMDYSRFNYVAQPEDNLDPEDLIPRIGPYDKWALMWGYKPVPGARTPDEEKAVLQRWVVEAQDHTPWLRFSTVRSMGSDPGENTEAVGDADAIQATELGLRNLKRVADLLLDAVPQPGQPYDDLEEVYGRVLGQWVREMNHVAALVGGFHSQQKHAGQEGVLFTPVPASRQALAVRFLNEHAFEPPRFLIRPQILRRIEPAGELDRIKNAQRSVLSNLLAAARFGRLVEQEALDGDRAYRPVQFLADLRAGIFRELVAPSIAIDAYRRNLQRAYIEILGDRLNGRPPAADDQRPMFRGELRAIGAEAQRALVRASDRTTRLHLEDLRDQIAKALDPKVLPPSPAAGPELPRRPSVEDPETCWPDLAIRPDPM